MPGCLPSGSRKTAFILISLLLLAAPATRAEEDFEAGLEEGRSHGTEILSRHSEILRPSAATRRQFRDTVNRFAKSSAAKGPGGRKTQRG